MRENLIREIETEYEAQRMANHAEAQRRLGEATLRDPAIGELSARRRALFQSSARDALSSPQAAEDIVRRLSEEISAISAALRARLVAAGYPEDYLQPVYKCEICHDAGYVGEPIRQRCECFLRRIREKTASVSGHGLNPRECFEAYDASIYPDTPLPEKPDASQREYMERVRERCESYAMLYPHNPRHNLLFVGKSGLGKTYLLNCIGNRVHQKGEEVIKLTAYQLTERMRAALFDKNPEPFAALLDVPLLLLDDLGAEPLFSNITIEQLFTLLNERSLSGLHTIISTNLMPDELSRRYTERICSRLFDKRSTTMLQFLGADVRMR